MLRFKAWQGAHSPFYVTLATTRKLSKQTRKMGYFILAAALTVFDGFTKEDWVVETKPWLRSSETVVEYSSCDSHRTDVEDSHIGAINEKESCSGGMCVGPSGVYCA